MASPWLLLLVVRRLKKLKLVVTQLLWKLPLLLQLLIPLVVTLQLLTQQHTNSIFTDCFPGKALAN